MGIVYNNNNKNLNILDINYNKIKINNLFLNSKFIIYIKLYDMLYLKTKLLNYNIFSLIIKTHFIKSIFDLSNFSFLRGEGYLCLFINDIITFINVINIFEKKQFFFSYKKCFSNLVTNFDILKEYNKYNINYIYIQLILKKIKIKIIILFLFFLISLIKNIKIK